MSKTLMGIFQEIDKLSKPKKPTKNKHVSVKHTKSFHKNKKTIDKTILKTLDDGEIIYGEQALKAYFPKYLERQTTDYDIYSCNPRRDAVEAERALDKRFGGDYFYVKKAEHPGTFKVVAHANQEGYADFTEMPQKAPYKTINGHRYIDLSVEKEHRLKSLKDPNSSWRHGKDQDALNRIKAYEENK